MQLPKFSVIRITLGICKYLTLGYRLINHISISSLESNHVLENYIMAWEKALCILLSDFKKSNYKSMYRSFQLCVCGCVVFTMYMLGGICKEIGPIFRVTVSRLCDYQWSFFLLLHLKNFYSTYMYDLNNWTTANINIKITQENLWWNLYRLRNTTWPFSITGKLKVVMNDNWYQMIEVHWIALFCFKLGNNHL